MTLVATNIPMVPEPASLREPPVPFMDLRAQYRGLRG